MRTRARRVTRTEYDGSITVVIDRFQGKRLNSPNDVVVASDGAIWFTDPPFGLSSFYEGVVAEQELNPNVYRVDPMTGQAAIVADDCAGPNGLASRLTRSVFMSSSLVRPDPQNPGV